MTLYDSLGRKCQDELWMMAGEIIENYSEMFGYINTGRGNITYIPYLQNHGIVVGLSSGAWTISRINLYYYNVVNIGIGTTVPIYSLTYLT